MDKKPTTQTPRQDPQIPRYKLTPLAWHETDDSLYPRHDHDSDDPPHPHSHGERRDPHTAKKKLKRKRKEFDQ